MVTSFRRLLWFLALLLGVAAVVVNLLASCGYMKQ